jgi:hypothetical protein
MSPLGRLPRGASATPPPAVPPVLPPAGVPRQREARIGAPPRSGGSVRGSPCGEPARLRFTSLRPPPAAAPQVPCYRARGSAGDQVNRRHTEMCGCRCFLPDLTGFADFRCGGPGRRRTRGRGIKNGGITARLGTWPSMAIGASGRSIAYRKEEYRTGTGAAFQVGGRRQARVRIPPATKRVRKSGGGGGIRTHVAARTAKSISSRPRYGHFGTPPRGEGGIISGGGRSFKHAGMSY